jgi:HEAT repeat protein
LAQSGSPAQRKVGLRALSSIGGPQALGVIEKAVSDSDLTVQDEAVNLLSTWPNTWPNDDEVAAPLLALIKGGKKPAYRVQAWRGYLQYMEESKKLSQPEKVSKVKELLPSAQGAEEKQQVISVLGTLPTPESLDLLTELSRDNTVSEEAYVAMLKVATDRKMGDASKDVRRNALEAVAQNAKDDATKKKAAGELNKL